MDNLLTGLSITVIGFCIVMGVLALLSFILSFFKYLNKPEKTSAAPVAAPVIETVAEVFEDVEDDVLDVSQSELAAVIAAAICAHTGAEPGSFVIQSVKRASSWNEAARRERQTRYI